jgi:hypothetical protein
VSKSGAELYKRDEVAVFQIHPVGHVGQYITFILLMLSMETPKAAAPERQSSIMVTVDRPDDLHDWALICVKLVVAHLSARPASP